MGSLVLLSFAVCGWQAEQPKHLLDALSLFRTVSSENNSYRHRYPEVRWQSDGQSAVCQCDCSGLLNALFPKSYPVISEKRLERWLGKSVPKAEDYFSAIQKQIGFDNQSAVFDIRAGDIVAIKYEDGADNTGHIMIALESAKRITAAKPIQDKAIQYSLYVLDVTNSPHSETDTRYVKGGKHRGGIGTGTIRIYANGAGEPVGHVWSLSTRATFRSQDLRPLIFGRLNLETIPK